VTEAGRYTGERDVAAAHERFLAEKSEQQRSKGRRRHGRARARSGGGDEAGSEDWKDGLLETLLAMSPAAFERLTQRLLREAGFINVNVTGRSGDGGIDGLGVYRVSLVGFPVFFQCKRYRASVGAGAVRDFRGAMAGRGDKGLLITTGSFTAEAKAEAVRDGAPPVDLIDGDRLCDLLKEYQLGVRVETRVTEDVEIDRAYFDGLGGL
jgi:restriction system protein